MKTIKSALLILALLIVGLYPVYAEDNEWERRASDGWPIYNHHYDSSEYVPYSPADDFFRSPGHYISDYSDKYVEADEY